MAWFGFVILLTAEMTIFYLICFRDRRARKILERWVCWEYGKRGYSNQYCLTMLNVTLYLFAFLVAFILVRGVYVGLLSGSVESD